MKTPQILGDYDGAIKTWNAVHRVPVAVQPFVDHVLRDIAEFNATTVVEVGSGKCLTSAAIVHRCPTHLDYYAVDMRWMGTAEGEYYRVTMDVSNIETFGNYLAIIQPQLIVGRRAFCLFLSEEWLNIIPKGTVITSQGLSGETQQEFFSPEVETVFLESNGWTILRPVNEHGIYTAVKNDDSIRASV